MATAVTRELSLFATASVRMTSPEIPPCLASYLQCTFHIPRWMQRVWGKTHLLKKTFTLSRLHLKVWDHWHLNDCFYSHWCKKGHSHHLGRFELLTVGLLLSPLALKESWKTPDVCKTPTCIIMKSKTKLMFYLIDLFALLFPVVNTSLYNVFIVFQHCPNILIQTVVSIFLSYYIWCCEISMGVSLSELKVLQNNIFHYWKFMPAYLCIFSNIS